MAADLDTTDVHGKAWFDAMLTKLRHPQKRTWIILNPASIGETVAVCALADAFVKEHGYSITMVVQPHHFAVTETYPDRFEQVFVMERAQILDIMRHCSPDRFDLDFPFAGFFYNLGDARSDAIAYLFKYPGRGGLSFTDTYRHTFRLPWNAPMERPRIPLEWMQQARDFAFQAGIAPGEAVTLFPGNSSKLAQFPDIFWRTLAVRLKKNGFRVFTNMEGGQFTPATMPIEGTTALHVTMRLGLPLTGLMGKVIGGSNGMIFWQAMGAQFDDMSLLFPLSCKGDNVLLNERIYAPQLSMMHYMAPEVTVDLPIHEFGVPFDGPEEGLVQLAESIADGSANSQYRFERRSPNGAPYVEDNAHWLRTLIESVPPRLI